MKSNLFSNNVTDTMLAQLPFIGDAMQVVGYPKKDVVLYNMYSVKAEDLEKIKKLLAGGSMPILPKKSKVYLLPNCMYTQVQMRTIVRMHGYTITDDISKANLFVGNSGIVLYPNNNGVSDALCTKEIRLKSTTINSPMDVAVIEAKFPNLVGNGALKLDIDTTLYFTNRYFSVKDSWTSLYATDNIYNLVSGECVEILYRHLSSNVPIVNEQDLFNSVERVTIDDDVYNTLDLMFKAGADDKKLAAEMVFNCDYDKSFYNIVRLIQKHGYDVSHYMGNTNFNIFDRSFRLGNIRSFTFNQTIDYLFNAGKLTEEIYTDILYNEMHKQEDDLQTALDKLKEFFAVDLFIKKSYQDYINENTPKNEESKSIPAGSESSSPSF